MAGLHVAVSLVPLMQANFASPFSSMLQAAVVSALSALCEEFYQAEPGQADTQMQGEWTLCPPLTTFSLHLELIQCVFIYTHTHI